MTKRRLPLFGLSAAMLLAALYLGGRDARTAAPAYRNAASSPPVVVPPLPLTDQHGRPFDLAALHGDVVAVFWGYLSCPDVCPLTLDALENVRRRLSADEREHFHVVMVTVDPERDTPEAMGRYLAGFDPAFVGLSGAPRDVRAAMAAWGVVVERTDRPDDAYLLAHPAQVTLIGRDGRWAVTAHFRAEPEDIAADVRTLIHRPPGDGDGAKSPAEGAADVADPEAERPAAGIAPPPLLAGAARSGIAPAAWLVARTDGSVARVGADGRTETEVLAPWTRRTPSDPVNPGAVLKAPAIAYDPQARTLWYSDTHASVRSLRLDTGEAGPALASFADTAIPGCGVASSGRLMALDPARRRLYVPLLTGQVLAYDLDTLDVRGSIPAAAFGDLVLGRYRAIAVDPGGALWALDAAGNAREYDPDAALPTGRFVSGSAEALVIEAGRGLLVLRDGDDGVRAVSLSTLQAMAAVWPPLDDAFFVSSMPGAE